MIIGLLEKSEKLEVGIAEMAVELGASAVFGDARFLVPRSRVAVEELVLSDAFAAVIEVDVLSLEQNKREFDTRAQSLVRHKWFVCINGRSLTYANK